MHPYIPEMKELYRKGQISRREFIRNAALLGLSLSSINSFLGAFPRAATSAVPTAAPAIKRGGTLRISSRVMRVDHPARMGWVEPSNQLRQVAEYLTLTDNNNITTPYLLEKWRPSGDLKTWTLTLRKGIKFNNGEELTADDVIFSMKQWLDPKVGSSVLGMMSYLKPTGIVKVDSYTIVLHLDRGQFAVPEHLFHYPAMILHRDFEGDFVKKPVGTGPYTLQQYVVGERVTLKRRNDYWQMGKDSKPLPYLDEIVYVDLGEEQSAHIAALQAGKIDSITAPTAATYLALKSDPKLNIASITTGQTWALRMRCDKKPWTDNRVRTALKICQEREKILKLAYFGEGMVGHDAHVAPVHPEYCKKPIPKYEPERAKALLAEAGYPDGVTVGLAIGSGWPEVVSYAETLKASSARAGFNLKLLTMPNTAYMDIFLTCDFGITRWKHRPLGPMVLSLVYTIDKNDKPVPWNETQWVDKEFATLLTQAEATYDLEKRRAIMCKLEDIQMERGSVGIAFWVNMWAVATKQFKNIQAHPSTYDLYNEVWYDPQAT